MSARTPPAPRQGDAAEARAIGAVFGPEVPVSSLKGNMGHTLGASGPIELAATLEMMQAGVVYPTHNLDEVDPACSGINLIKEKTPHRFETFLKNSFAFGGINASHCMQSFAVISYFFSSINSY